MVRTPPCRDRSGRPVIGLLVAASVLLLSRPAAAEPVSISELLDLAATNAPGVVAAQVELQAAQLGAELARAAGRPGLQVAPLGLTAARRPGATALADSTDSLAVDVGLAAGWLAPSGASLTAQANAVTARSVTGQTEAVTAQLDLRAGVSQPVARRLPFVDLRLGRTDLDGATLRESAAVQALDGAVAAARLSVLRAAVEVLNADDQLVLRELEGAWAERVRAVTADEFADGKRSITEDVEAELALYDAGIAVENARRDRADRLRRLLAVVSASGAGTTQCGAGTSAGWPDPDAASFSVDSRLPPVRPLPALSEWYGLMRAVAPEIARAMNAVEAAELELRTARFASAGSVTLGVSASPRADASAADATEAWRSLVHGNAGWNVSGNLQFRMPIADGGAWRVRAARAELAAVQASGQAEQAEAELSTVVESLAAAVERARRSAESVSAREALVAARLEQARTLYEEGVISLVDLAETELIAERAAAASRQADRTRYVAEFEALGRLGY